MSDQSPSIAVIGCGAWGINHVRVWRELECLAVACDTNTSSLKAIQARYADVPTSLDVTAVLKRPDIAAVVIATATVTHAPLALQALEAGKDVLVEKPLAMTVAQGQQLVDTARRLRRVLMVGHILEYHPAIAKLKELVADGTLGPVQYLYSNRLNLGRIRTEENALWSFAPHDLSVILRLLGTMPEEVTCHGGAYLNHRVADVTLTGMSFPGNVRAHVFVSWLHPFKEHRFVVVAGSQMAVFDDTLPWPQKLVLYPHRIDWIEGQLPIADKAEAVPVELEEVEPLRSECEHFLQCVATRRPPLTDGGSGLAVLRVLEAAQSSLEKAGMPQRLGDGS